MVMNGTVMHVEGYIHPQELTVRTFCPFACTPNCSLILVGNLKEQLVKIKNNVKLIVKPYYSIIFTMISFLNSVPLFLFF